ncbi:hypothetical protein V8E36_006201 [Tilletia maclaganii]
MSSSPSSSAPDPPMTPSRPLLGGPASMGADVFGPTILTPHTLQPDTRKRDRNEAAEGANGTPASTTSTPGNGASPRKRKAKGSTAMPAVAADVDGMDLTALRAHVKHAKGAPCRQPANKQLAAALPRKPAGPPPQARPVPDANKPNTASVPAPTATPTESAAEPASRPTSYAQAARMSQEDAWSLVRPRSVRTSPFPPPSGGSNVDEALVTVYVALHRAPMAKFRRALQALGVRTSLIRDYAWVRENTLQVLVPTAGRDSLIASFKTAEISVFENFDPTRPSSQSPSAEEREYAWTRLTRIAESGIEHGRSTNRPGVVAFYEEWKRREDSRRAAELATSGGIASNATAGSPASGVTSSSPAYGGDPYVSKAAFGSLRVLSINARGLQQRKLTQIQQWLDGDADIVCVQETWHLADSVYAAQPSFCRVRPFLTTTEFHQHTLRISLQPGFDIGFIYTPPSHSLSDVRAALQTLAGCSLVMGDFNTW